MLFDALMILLLLPFKKVFFAGTFGCCLVAVWVYIFVCVACFAI
jgi:hypothetical protein